MAAEVLPKGFSIAWTGLSLQEVEAAGLAAFLIVLALVFCYLFLVALYESWMLAFAVMFSTVFAILGAVVGLQSDGAGTEHLRTARTDYADRFGGKKTQF